jgi:hypothetical protein
MHPLTRLHATLRNRKPKFCQIPEAGVFRVTYRGPNGEQCERLGVSWADLEKRLALTAHKLNPL